MKPLTVLKMKKELCNKYRKICKYKGYKDGKEKETNQGMALTMADKIKSQCGKSGNWGHKSAQCAQKKNAQQMYHQKNRQA